MPVAAPANFAPLWTEKETAARLGVSTRKLQEDRQYGAGVPFVKIGRVVRYRPEAVTEYLTAQERRSTSDRRAA